MNAEDRHDWRHLVHAHIKACWRDMRAHLESRLSGCEARFIAEYGSEAVRQGYDNVAKATCDRLGEPAAKESYKMIEESSNRLLVEVPRPRQTTHDELPVPIVTTRFLLLEKDGGWEIACIYQPCIGCNFLATGHEVPPTMPGKCFFCHGRGEDLIRRKQFRGFGIFRRLFGKPVPCKHCGGKGICPECAGEEVPGWQRRF